MGALLDIRHLSVDIGKPVLWDFSMMVGGGCVAGLVGESGVGKTMVGRALLGLLPPESVVRAGEIIFDGYDLGAMPDKLRRKHLGKDIALIPQNPMTALNPVLRIRAQMEDVLSLHLQLRGEAAHRRAHEMLEAAKLSDAPRVLRSFPHELSGGMLQRVLIAIAFACHPKLVIADEPTTALDVITQREILLLIQSMQQRDGSSVLFITHDLAVVANLCDEVHVMCEGRIVEHGPTASLFRHPSHAYTRALLDAALADLPDGVA